MTAPRVRALLVVLLLISGMAGSGCGYALAGRGSFLPDYIRVIGIPPLENRTANVQADQVLTEHIRTEFIGRGRYTVVTDAEGADAVLTGEITTISVQPVAYTEQQLASRYLFTLLMKVQFRDVRTNEVLWSNDALTFREEYDLATSGVLEGASFLDQEPATFQRIATDIARTVVTAILEAF